MIHLYDLRISSTGEIIRTEESDKTLLAWQRKWERKLLRLKRTPDRVRVAIANGDTIAGWASYDAFVISADDTTIASESKRVFRGYDKWFELREAAVMDAPLAKAA